MHFGLHGLICTLRRDWLSKESQNNSMKKFKRLIYIVVLGCCMSSCNSKKVITEVEEQRPQTIDVLIKHRLNGIVVNYDMVELESLGSDDMYSYLDALDLAIESFLTDDTYPESPLGIVPTKMTSYKGNESKSQQHLEKVIELINSGGSLCMPDIEGAPDSCAHAEEGEEVERNWIFLLQIPDLSDHMFWAVVPKDGKAPVYNYGFN